MVSAKPQFTGVAPAALAEMRYINLVSCHHDSFALWDSKAEPFNSMTAPAHRDLVGELDEKPGTGIAVMIDVEDAVGVVHQAQELSEIVEENL